MQQVHPVPNEVQILKSTAEYSFHPASLWIHQSIQQRTKQKLVWEKSNYEIVFEIDIIEN